MVRTARGLLGIQRREGKPHVGSPYPGCRERGNTQRLQFQLRSGYPEEEFSTFGTRIAYPEEVTMLLMGEQTGCGQGAGRAGRVQPTHRCAMNGAPGLQRMHKYLDSGAALQNDGPPGDGVQQGSAAGSRSERCGGRGARVSGCGGGWRRGCGEWCGLGAGPGVSAG